MLGQGQGGCHDAASAHGTHAFRLIGLEPRPTKEPDPLPAIRQDKHRGIGCPHLCEPLPNPTGHHSAIRFAHLIENDDRVRLAPEGFEAVQDLLLKLRRQRRAILDV